MFCYKCGAQIDDESVFCASCGAQVKKPMEKPAQASEIPEAAPAPVSAPVPVQAQIQSQIQPLVQPQAPVAPRPVPRPVRRQRRSGKATAARFWAKFLCAGGILANIFALMIYPMSGGAKAGFFQDLYYYLTLAIEGLTIVAAGWVLTNGRRKPLKLYSIIPGVLGLIMLLGGIYGIFFEYYAKTAYSSLTSIGGTILLACSAALCAVALITGKNILNFLSLVTDIAGTGLLWLFFAVCMINKYYYAEMLFCIACLDMAGIATVMLFLLGGYNSDRKFDLKNAPTEVAPVTEAKDTKEEAANE